MRRIRAIVLLLGALGLLVVSTGCTSTHKDTGYYRRGTAHRDSFPPNYVPGRHRSWGSYGRW